MMLSLIFVFINIIPSNAKYLNLDLDLKRAKYKNINVTQSGNVMSRKMTLTYEAADGHLITSVSCDDDIFYEDKTPGDTTRRVVTAEIRECFVLVKIESEYLGYKERKYYLKNEVPLEIKECEFNKLLYDDDERLMN